jgi:hypothetical protein
VVPADETVEARRKIALRATGGREHGRVLTPAHRDRRKRRQTLEVDLAQSHKVLAAARPDERTDRLGSQDLAACSGSAQPRRLDDRHAVVVARPLGDITGADADPYPERDLGILVAPRDEPLDLRRSRDRVRSARKRRHVAVARVLDDLAVIRGDRLAD